MNADPMQRARAIINFLRGEGPIDGHWFGDKPTDAKGNFWWRQYLPEIEQALTREEEVLGEGWPSMETAPPEYDKRLLGLLSDGRAVTIVRMKSVSGSETWCEETGDAFLPRAPIGWMHIPADIRDGALGGDGKKVAEERDKFMRLYDAARGDVEQLQHEVAKKDRALHARNVALDGMAWVWCNGGCESGVFRFSDAELTDEMLAMIERNTERLRTWAKNRDCRSAIRSAPPEGEG